MENLPEQRINIGLDISDNSNFCTSSIIHNLEHGLFTLHLQLNRQATHTISEKVEKPERIGQKYLKDFMPDTISHHITHDYHRDKRWSRAARSIKKN